MSRIGRKEIVVPAGVTVTIGEGNDIVVKGSKGELKQKLCSQMAIAQEGNVITVTRPNDNKENRSLHGLTRTLLNNMIVGVDSQFSKELDVIGVGYRVQMQGKNLVMNVGYSHPVTMTPPDGVGVECPTANRIVIKGCDKQKVGQFAAEVREQRPPEPYLGKGVKYVDEVIRRKEGKAGAKK